MKPPYGTSVYPVEKSNPVSSEMVGPPWQGRSISGPKLRLVEFSAFLEQQRDHDNVCVLSC